MKSCFVYDCSLAFAEDSGVGEYVQIRFSFEFLAGITLVIYKEMVGVPHKII
jgi:hypothetical protein